MHRKNRNIVPLGLIIFCLLILSTFMGFWVKKAYQEQYDWLQKETSSLFVNATRRLEDSLIQKVVRQNVTIERIDSVDISMMHIGDAIQRTDSSALSSFQYEKGTKRAIRLSSARHFDLPSDTGRMKSELQVVVKTDMDRALSGLIGSVFLTLQDTAAGNSANFKIDADSIRLPDLYQAYSADLEQAGIVLDFSIDKLESGDTIRSLAGLWTAEAKAGFDLSNRYLAYFPEFRWYLIKKIVPHILFSLFLILLTAVSFWFIYWSLQKQQRLTELKNDLIRNITHELKTPVTTVGVAIEALSNFNALQDPKRTKEYLDISKNELHRLSILIDKVLKMAIFEQKGLVLKVEDINLKTLVEEILASMRLQFERQKATVDYTTNGEDFHLEGDRIHLTSVIYNLIDNALKYTFDNPRIVVELHNSTDSLRLVVADNGVGIAPEHQEKIFEKFYRVPSGERHDTKGYGLGLSYVANVVKQHHGTVHLESKQGKGSRFSIRIPRKHGKD